MKGQQEFFHFKLKAETLLVIQTMAVHGYGEDIETMQAPTGTIYMYQEDTKHTHCSQAHINQDVILCQSGQVFQL